MEAERRHQELLARKALHGEAVASVQIIVRRQNRQQRVVAQAHPLERHALLPAGKAQIHFILTDPAEYILDVAHPDLHIHAGVVVAELLDHLRQPVNRDGGIGRDAHRLLPVRVDAPDLAAEGLVGVEQIADQRKNPLARGRQPHALPPAQQNGKADVLFETVHHMCQAGLRISQILRRAGEASVFHRSRKGLQFFRIHTKPPYCYEIFSYFIITAPMRPCKPSI